MDEKKNRMSSLEEVLNQYSEQKNVVTKKLKKLQNNFLLSLLCYLIAKLGELYVINYIGHHYIRIFYAKKEMSGLIVLEILLSLALYGLIRNGCMYAVHTELPLLKKWIEKKNIFTLKAEERFCKDRIAELEEDQKFEDNISYEEKKADCSVEEFFRKKKVILFIIMIAITVAKVYF